MVGNWAGKGEPHFVILHKLSIIQLCGAVGCKAVQAHTVVVGAFKHHHQRIHFCTNRTYDVVGVLTKHR